MDNKDLFGVLCIIDSFGELNFRKRLQKLVCISKYDKGIGYPFSFEFSRWLYGPYSVELKNLMDRLILGGIVKEEFSKNGYSYSLTEDGRHLLKKIPKKDLEIKINKLIKMYGSKTVSEITTEAKAFYGW